MTAAGFLLRFLVACLPAYQPTCPLLAVTVYCDLMFVILLLLLALRVQFLSCL